MTLTTGTTTTTCCATSAPAATGDCCAVPATEAACCAPAATDGCCAPTAEDTLAQRCFEFALGVRDDCSVTAAPARAKRRRVTRPFVRHYLEMVAAMFAGMVVLGTAVDGLIALTGADAVTRAIDGPLAMGFVMCAYMVAGMAGWMAYRGHSLRQNVEMNAAMVAPMALLVPLEIAGALSGHGLMVWLHVLMLASMWLYMLGRPMDCH